MTRLEQSFLELPLAHRACHDVHNGRPENSRAAIAAAITAGYGIEIDVQLSADDNAMVFHDYDLGRLTAENGPVRQRSAAELAQISLLGGSEGIPTLNQVLDLVDGRVPLLIEIKDQDGALGAEVGPLEQAVATALAACQGPVAVMSFNPHSIARIQDLTPGIARGLTTGAYRKIDWRLLPNATRTRLRAIPDYDRVGASFISHQSDDLARPRVGELKEQGAAILCWTIRSTVAEKAARKYADNITFGGYAAQIPGA